MNLNDFPLAPSPRRVRMFIVEKGIDIESVQIQVRQGEQFPGAFRIMNPWNYVPALHLDDGTMISEVPEICRYFEELHPDPPLMGRNAKERDAIVTWDRWADDNGFTPVADSLRKSFERFQNRAAVSPAEYARIPELAERGKDRTRQFLGDLDARLGDVEWVAGDAFSIADITTFVVTHFAGLIDVSIPEDATNLKRWHEVMCARPSAQA